MEREKVPIFQRLGIVWRRSGARKANNAEHLTKLPPRDVLNRRLQAAIESAQARFKGRPDE